MERNIETQIAESVFDAFTMIFAKGITEQERQELFEEIRSIDIDGEPIGRVLMGVLVASKALFDNLTGGDAKLSEVAGAFGVLANAMENGEMNGNKPNGGE